MTSSPVNATVLLLSPLSPALFGAAATQPTTARSRGAGTTRGDRVSPCVFAVRPSVRHTGRCARGTMEEWNTWKISGPGHVGP
jgi:hypothetical protein